MKVECMLCGSDLNLDHPVFDDYRGAVKCFCCSTMMEIRTRNGELETVQLVPISLNAWNECSPTSAPM